MLKKKDRQSKKRIIEKFLRFVKQYHRIPSSTDLKKKYNITERQLDYYFGGLLRLITEMKKTRPTVVNSILDVNALSSDDYTELKGTIKESKRFLITTAVSGCKVDTRALSAFETYCTENKAELLVIPVYDPAHSWSKGSFDLDFALKNKHIVFTQSGSDIALNSNCRISAISITAKQIQPLTGLSRLTNNKKTMIFGSPKQFAEYTPHGTLKLPHVLMTTGCVTRPDYTSEYNKSQRTAYIAEHDHMLGGIVVEVVDEKEFHFRHVQCDNNGLMVDLDRSYDADSVKEQRPNGLVLGDLHIGETDENAIASSRDQTKTLRPKFLFDHDIFTGLSISPHAERDFIRKVLDRQVIPTVEEETYRVFQFLQEQETWGAEEIIVVYSNHDEWLYRYIATGRYFKDPHNFSFVSGLVPHVLKEKNPLEVAVRSFGKLKSVTFLPIDYSFKIGGLECGAHGHKGAFGKWNPSLAELEKGFKKGVFGHRHRPGLWRNTMQVGTNSRLDLPYVKGSPSGWFHTNGIVHSTGHHSLINTVNNNWRL